MLKNFLLLKAVILLLTITEIKTNSSSPPVWVSSSFFKAGGVTFSLTGGATTQTGSLAYSTSMVQSSLKVPCMGITDLRYQISSGVFLLQVQVISYSRTGLSFQVIVNTNPSLKILKMTYMALDNSFTPAFSMNYFFPNVNKYNSGGIFVQYYVNFTQSTGVVLNTSNQNVLLPFLHYLDIETYDNTLDINLDFTLINGSFYTVIIKSSSNIYINYAGFSRLIFDKTAIQALGNDYFNYGIVEATNNNSTALSTIIPPDIISANFYYGLHSFTISSNLAQIHFTSTYNVTSGFLGYTGVAPYVFSKMKFSYMHHKTRTCPAGFPYYNISELLCYDSCNVGWYADTATMTCKKCLYDCYTCTNATGCTACNASTNYRYLNGTRCSPLAGYYDNNTNNPVAAVCTSPCATCRTTATNCLSCIYGYYLSGNQCLSCNSAINHCNSCTNSSFCLLCASGANGTTCSACPANQYLDAFGACASCSSAISNCQSCTSSTSCTLCQPTFTLHSPTNCACTATQYLSNGSCVECSTSIPYCSACSNPTTCTGCMATFNLASATVCQCNSTSYLNTTSSSCISCTAITNYCSTCSNTSCSTCMNTFTLSGGVCTCSSGYYADSVNKVCAACSGAISNCATCSSSTQCATCASGYKLNTTTYQCQVQTCQVANCHACNAGNTSICSTCETGYSLNNSDTQCITRCGDKQFNSATEACDDGNTISGDGCSSTCQLESGFSCSSQIVNLTMTFSQCYYSASITFSLIWIRKIEGTNTLKFEFELGQKIQQWSTVNFTKILAIDNVDSTTNLSTGLGSQMISSYRTEFSQSKNRFSVTLDYAKYTMQGKYLSFSLTPYANSIYPAFTPPVNVEFFPPVITCIVKVDANNNQNANLYSSAIYGAYSISVKTTYAVVAVALLTLVTSLVFRTGKVITFQMITVMQLTYFSLSFLDSINPVFSGLLPLRFLAGILNFKGVQDYLEQTTSPNNMKGIYMFLDLSNNFTFLALSIISFLVLGGILYLVYVIIDWVMNESKLGHQVSTQNRSGYTFYKLAFNFIGELALSLIIICLPLYSIGIVFEAFYKAGSGQFWSYAMGIGIAAAVSIYFIALIKQKYQKNGDFTKLGEYISQFNPNTIFQSFKYTNLIMIEVALISTLIMVTIYSNNKLFATIFIIFIAFVDIVIISIAKPYLYGFVSCFKGEDNNTESLFEKIELYKVYDKEQPQVIRIQNPDVTQKSEQVQNNSEVFAQHFATRKNVIKTKHQGLIQGGQILNHTKLFLFNNNFRRIFNLITLVVVEFVFACVAIYKDQINQNYEEMNIKVALPLLIHSVLFLNVVYNYAILILQILNRTRSTLGRVENQPESSSQFTKSLYTQKQKKQSQATEIMQQTTFQTNQQIIKTNLAAKSLYDLKRPKMIHPFRTKLNVRKGKQKQTKIVQNKMQSEQQ